MDRQYNNELTPELLATMDKSPFTAEQLSGMNNETIAGREGEEIPEDFLLSVEVA
ncbi:hypothetical protein PT300_01935 [Enterobacteriaceae bacterium ESL0689]|nr:hypothetical protein [Enterobacteriaceae bacterium ESL0689]